MNTQNKKEINTIVLNAITNKDETKPTPTHDRDGCKPVSKFDTLLNELKEIYVSQHEVAKMREQLKEVFTRLDAIESKIRQLDTYKADTQSNGDEIN